MAKLPANALDPNLTPEQVANLPSAHREFYLRFIKDVDLTGIEIPPDDNRDVYFIRAETGQIKIGVAADAQKRLASLQCASPVKLELVAVCKGGGERESEYHYRFMEYRLHGEWFEPHRKVLKEIARLSLTLEGEG